MLALSATVAAAPARWDVDGVELAPVHANFHVHTVYSAAEASPGRQRTGEHALCETPDRVRQRATAAGLQVIAFSDHCFQLDPWEWGLRPWPAEQLPSAGADWRALTILGNSGRAEPDRCLALPGFEWTPGADWWDLTNPLMRLRKLGHINIFYPDLTAADVANLERAKTHPILCSRKQERRQRVWAAAAPGAAVDCPDLPALYTRLREQMRRGADAPLAQFSHVYTELGLGEPGHAVEVYPLRFNRFAFDPQLVDCFVLFELATIAEHAYWIKGLARCDLAPSLPVYDQALAAGWRVAPSIGSDNNDDRLEGASASYTGLWLPAGPLTPRDVVTALRQRRVFATEFAGLAVAFWATLAEAATVPMGAVTRVPKGGTLRLRAAFTTESNNALPAFSQVRVIEVRAHAASVATDVTGTDGAFALEVTPHFDTRCYYVVAFGPPRHERPRAGIVSAPIWVEPTTTTPQ